MYCAFMEKMQRNARVGDPKTLGGSRENFHWVKPYLSDALSAPASPRLQQVSLRRRREFDAADMLDHVLKLLKLERFDEEGVRAEIIGVLKSINVGT